MGMWFLRVLGLGTIALVSIFAIVEAYCMLEEYLEEHTSIDMDTVKCVLFVIVILGLIIDYIIFA